MQLLKHGLVLLLLLLLLLLPLAVPAPLRAGPFTGGSSFADPAFLATWSRTDHPAVQAGRTFFWGPLPWLDTAEYLRQGQHGLRTVQYFDKARMEINDTATRSYHGGVTNGLLDFATDELSELTLDGESRWRLAGW